MDGHGSKVALRYHRKRGSIVPLKYERKNRLYQMQALALFKNWSNNYFPKKLLKKLYGILAIVVEEIGDSQLFPRRTEGEREILRRKRKREKKAKFIDVF